MPTQLTYDAWPGDGMRPFCVVSFLSPGLCRLVAIAGGVWAGPMFTPAAGKDQMDCGFRGFFMSPVDWVACENLKEVLGNAAKLCDANPSMLPFFIFAFLLMSHISCNLISGEREGER